MVSRLDQHSTIALDFDGTLIQAPQAPLLWQYIRKHHKQKKFWIVTFRSHGMERSVFRDLYYAMLEEDEEPLAERMFVGIKNISNVMFEQFREASRLRHEGKLGPDPHPHEVDFNDYKGLTCKEIGATVLIDDMAQHTAMGCIKYGIDFIATQDLEGAFEQFSS